MTDKSDAIVPVWTLATGDVRLPALITGDALTADRLSDLRSALAVLAEHPIATLEVHPLPNEVELSHGIPLDAASPLARHLSEFISRATPSSSTPSVPAVPVEGLYRMVVPEQVSEQLGQGVLRMMKAKDVPGGIRSAVMNSTGVADHVAFVPAGEAASAAAAGGAGAVVGTAAAGGVTLAVAAPLVLMAVAVGASAAADYQRQQAIEQITELLEQLHEQVLENERSELEGCRDAIDKATALLLDEGKLGVSLGLDSAVHEIGKALAAAERRVTRWRNALDKLPDVEAVDLDALIEAIPGVDEERGRFRAHLELASLAIALKRRVIVLQAVEHAQLDSGNLFETFVRALKSDEQRVDRLESSIAEILIRLSELQIARPRGLRSPVVLSGEVDRLLRSAHHLHALGAEVVTDGSPVDVAIDIVRHGDGSVIVMPARAV